MGSLFWYLYFSKIVSAFLPLCQDSPSVRHLLQTFLFQRHCGCITATQYSLFPIVFFIWVLSNSSLVSPHCSLIHHFMCESHNIQGSWLYRLLWFPFAIWFLDLSQTYTVRQLLMQIAFKLTTSGLTVSRNTKFMHILSTFSSHLVLTSYWNTSHSKHFSSCSRFLYSASGTWTCLEIFMFLHT